MSSPFPTTDLQRLVARFQQGDREAADELFHRVADRLVRIARNMLRRFPQARGQMETGDLVTDASLSLLRALRELSFDSTRGFYGLAAEHMRRRLIDLARRQRRAREVPLSDPDGVLAPEEDDLGLWADLHELVERLPAEQREVFSLRFYHGWDNQAVAELLQVSTKTVTRQWLRAQLTLSRGLGDRPLPADDGCPG